MKSLLLLLVLFSCSKKLSNAEDVLDQFVRLRFEKNPSRDLLLSMTGGKMNQHFSQMSEEDWDSFISKKITLKSFKVQKKNCDEDICSFVYVIRFLQIKEKEKSYAVDVKKVATLKKDVQNQWKIVDVLNLKTHIGQ